MFRNIKGYLMRNFKTICIASLWNPLLIIVFSLIRGFSLPLDPEIYFLLLPTLIAGLILYFAVLKIHNSGRKRTAKVLFVILAPITSLLSIIGGLFGPIGIILYSLVASVPAWAYWLVCKFMDTRKTQEKG